MIPRVFKWSGYRMESQEAKKFAVKANPVSWRPCGRPSLRWSDDVVDGLAGLKLRASEFFNSDWIREL